MPKKPTKPSAPVPQGPPSQNNRTLSEIVDSIQERVITLAERNSIVVSQLAGEDFDILEKSEGNMRYVLSAIDENLGFLCARAQSLNDLL